MLIGETVLAASRPVPGDIRATFVRIIAYIGALAILAVAAASLARGPVRLATTPRTAEPAWINVDHPHPAFDMQMPELAGADFNYAILRRNADGARQDVLTWGGPSSAGPYVRVEIDRSGAADERFGDASSEIAARLVNFSLPDGVNPAGDLASKFGTVPLVNFAIAAPGTHVDALRRCLGFAVPFDDPPMQIAGWYCGAGDQAIDHATLACALDRLSLLSAGGDTEIARLFARAELKRTVLRPAQPDPGGNAGTRRAGADTAPGQVHANRQAARAGAAALIAISRPLPRSDNRRWPARPCRRPAPCRRCASW